LNTIEYHIKEILKLIGEDPDREGLKETPKRVEKMFKEIFKGINYTNKQISEMYDKCFNEDVNIYKYDNMILVKNIPCFSFCEHHIALMYNMNISVAYIPCNKVIGLSKISRIVDMVCRRLQLQERIGVDIVEIINIITGSQDIAVSIEAEHSCVSMRGIQKNNVKTITTTFMGKFNENENLKNRFILLLK